jgi:hypothetical protein
MLIHCVCRGGEPYRMANAAGSTTRSRGFLVSSDAGTGRMLY